MTIDETISHTREVAESQKMSARLIEDNEYIPESVDKEAIIYGNTICADEHEQLAEWLEELKQYRAIGTVEECLAAVEKQTAKRPRIMGNAMICPSCPRCFKSDNSAHCPSCGQKLKWEDEE
jgi:rubrerythrin